VPDEVKIGVFLHSALDGRCSELAVKVLPETSPLRTALLEGERMSQAELGMGGIRYPLECIVYEPAEPRGAAPAEEGLLEAVGAQIEELPEESQESIELCLQQDVLMLSMPLPGSQKLIVSYETAEPHRMCAVQAAVETGETIDLTDSLVSGREGVRLADVHTAVIRKVRKRRSIAKVFCALLKIARISNEHTADSVDTDQKRKGARSCGTRSSASASPSKRVSCASTCRTSSSTTGREIPS